MALNKLQTILLKSQYRNIGIMLSRNISSSPYVVVEEKGNAGVITLSREKALNSINLEMVQQIYKALKGFEHQKDLVIIKGVGKAFCAGGDVRSVVEGSVSDGKEFFRNEYRNNELIGSYKKPYIAIIDGFTMGGGVGLSVHGKYRICTERTDFSMPETKIGLFPDVGGGYFLPRMTGNIGIYLGLTGYRLKGRNVLDAGIATHYVESKNLEELENDLIRCKTSTEIDQLLSKYTPKQNHEFVLQPHLKNIEKAFSADKIEEILHNLHSIGNEWAMDTLKLLSKMSPASLKITLRQLQLGKTMTLKECLQMEFRLATHCCIDSDFKEGVRALLIDKDQKPRWKHSKVEEVTQEYVERFFSPLPDFDELEFDSKSKL